jgi:O-acetylhomoserine/O-acetylserine sulfhydrylase-like pyridoxal-dependent enzyme
VPYARASDPAIVIERFGGEKPGPVYLSLHNPGTDALAFSVRVAAGRLHLSKGAKALDRVSGGVLPVSAAPGGIEFPVKLAPGDVTVVALGEI